MVRWVDTAGRSGWESWTDGTQEGVEEATSVGYLVAEHEDRVVLAQSITDNQERMADTLAIPRLAIRSMEPMRLVGRRSKA